MILDVAEVRDQLDEFCVSPMSNKRKITTLYRALKEILNLVENAHGVLRDVSGHKITEAVRVAVSGECGMEPLTFGIGWRRRCTKKRYHKGLHSDDEVCWGDTTYVGGKIHE